jgi:hypothetical protein
MVPSPRAYNGIFSCHPLVTPVTLKNRVHPLCLSAFCHPDTLKQEKLLYKTKKQQVKESSICCFISVITIVGKAVISFFAISLFVMGVFFKIFLALS